MKKNVMPYGARSDGQSCTFVINQMDPKLRELAEWPEEARTQNHATHDTPFLPSLYEIFDIFSMRKYIKFIDKSMITNL